MIDISQFDKEQIEDQYCFVCKLHSEKKDYLGFKYERKLANSIKDKIPSLLEPNYPLILKVIGYGEIETNDIKEPMVVTEYLDLKRLADLKITDDRNFKKFTHTQRYIIALGIAYGMNFLHSKDYIHKNLRPSEIWIDKNFYPHISLLNFENTNNGDDIDLFDAPEVSRDDQDYSKPSDVYSYSVIIYQLFTNQSKIMKNQYQKMKNMKSFFESCLNENPEERPPFNKIIKFLLNDKVKKELNVDDKKINNIIETFTNFSNKKSSSDNNDDKHEDEEEVSTSKEDKSKLKNKNPKEEEESSTSKEDRLKLKNKNPKEDEEEESTSKEDKSKLKNKNPKEEEENSTSKEDRLKLKNKNPKEEEENSPNKEDKSKLKNKNPKEEEEEEEGSTGKEDQSKLKNDISGRSTKKKTKINKKHINNNPIEKMKIEANEGNVESMMQFAEASYNGDGVDIDYEEAATYYKMAADKGNVEAMVKYADICRYGLLGVFNINEALCYYKKAKAKDNEVAIKSIIALENRLPDPFTKQTKK